MKLGWVCTEAARAQRLKSAQPSPGTVPQGRGAAKGTRWKRFLRDPTPWICRAAFPTLTGALTAWVEKGRAGTATGRMGVQGRQGLGWAGSAEVGQTSPSRCPVSWETSLLPRRGGLPNSIIAGERRGVLGAGPKPSPTPFQPSELCFAGGKGGEEVQAAGVGQHLTTVLFSPGNF